MIKHSYLRNCQYDKSLKLSNGDFVHNYRELVEELKFMPNSEFKQHKGKNYDEFSGWIMDCFGDKVLVDRLKNITDKQRYTDTINSRIKELTPKEKKHVRLPWKAISITVIFLLLAVIFFQYGYFTDQIKEYENEVKLLNYDLSQIRSNSNLNELRIADLESQLKQAQNTTEEQPIPQEKAYGPQDWITADNIFLQENKVVININNPFLAKFKDTDSMLPVITSTSNAIEIIPTEESDISIGDIISYESSDGRTLVHRVIDIDSDDDGWYALLKGDNLAIKDLEKVRFDKIKRIVVGIIY